MSDKFNNPKLDHLWNPGDEKFKAEAFGEDEARDLEFVELVDFDGVIEWHANKLFVEDKHGR